MAHPLVPFKRRILVSNFLRLAVLTGAVAAAFGFVAMPASAAPAASSFSRDADDKTSDNTKHNVSYNTSHNKSYNTSRNVSHNISYNTNYNTSYNTSYNRRYDLGRRNLIQNLPLIGSLLD